MSTATQDPPQFLHLVLADDPPTGKRPRARLVPIFGTTAMLARVDEILRAREQDGTKFKRLLGCFRTQIYHPEDGVMRSWQQSATAALDRARQAYCGASPIAPVGAPIEVYMLAVFELAKSHWRKREPVTRQWQLSRNAGDWDNLAKPFCDAASGTLWPDDAQVVRGMVEKVVGAQGEAPRLEVLVRPLVDRADDTIFEALAGNRERLPFRGGPIQEGLWPTRTDEATDQEQDREAARATPSPSCASGSPLASGSGSLRW